MGGRSRRRTLAVLVATLGLLAIAVVQNVPRRHSMEQNLTGRTVRALHAAGLSDVDVRFVGRDGAVTVPSAADVQRATSIVTHLAGVRVVTVRPRRPAPAPPTATSAPSPASSPSASPSPSPSAPPVQTQLATLPDITFENASATLTAQGQASVARAAAILRANPTVRVRIEGHTDSTGDPATNMTLSQARAQTVLNALVAHGVARSRLTAVGYGQSRPKVPDTSPANRAINRRVAFIVLP